MKKLKIEDFVDKIIQGDSIKIMKKIPEESINMIITSPPYNVGIQYTDWNDNLPEKEYWDWTDKWMYMANKCLKKDGRIAVNIPVIGNNPEMKKSNKYLFHLPQYLSIIKKYFMLRECITWIKSYAEYDENVFCGGNTAWGSYLSASEPYCRSFSEFIIVAHKENSKLQHNGISDITKDEFLKYTKNVWFFPSEVDRTHPAPFPKQLPYRLIKLYTYVDDLVMDPFAGRGTTLLVCKEHKRKYIGIEISKEYYNMAKNELNQELLF